jgi:hypothetical protein
MTGAAPLAALALLSWGAGVSASAAADRQFQYSAGLEESYLSDVFRTGGDDVPGDYVTTASLSSTWSARTPRSTTQLQYTPEYLMYAQFSDLSHLEHTERASWSLNTGPRSTLRIGQGFALGEEQRGFLDFSEGTGEAIQPRSERWVADLAPSYSVSLSRRVNLDLRGAYRLSRYEADELVDSDQAGVEIAPTVQVGRVSRVGGALSVDSYEFHSAVDLGPRIDSFARLEALWSVSNGRGLNGSVSAGMFRASGPGLGSATEPSYRVSVGYQALGNQMVVFYNKGYSVNPRAARVLGTETGSLLLSRQWRSGLRTSARGSYLLEETFEGTEEVTGSRDGYGVDLDVAYTWKSGLGLGARYSRLKQERIDGDDLDYTTASVSLLYQPAYRAAGAAVPQGRPQS